MFMIDLGVQSYYSMLGVSPTASSEEIRTARDQQVKQLREALRNAKTVEEKQRLNERQTEVNNIGETLARPKKREEYDRANASLSFFTVQVAAAPLFVDKADRLHVLHRAIRRFLAEKGVALQPLSDLDREDFSADETPIALLDQLLEEDTQ